jgi:hypothetical protein
MERKALIFMLMISLLFFGVSCFSQPPPDVPGKSITWHVLLIVIPNTAVTIKLNGKESVYAGSMTPQQIRDGIDSFIAYPYLAQFLTKGVVHIRPTIEITDNTISKVTVSDDNVYLYPSDIAPILKKYDGKKRFDSIMVYWLRGSMPSYGWGYSFGLTESGATYCTVTDAPTDIWQVPRQGEVFLHEWLHGVASYFRKQGYESQIPPKDADGGGAYGYHSSTVNGWCGYYADLMNGNVLVDGKRMGFTPAMWLSGTPVLYPAAPAKNAEK